LFLFEPGRTQFDLNFRLFGVDVRIHPMFWLVTAILGWDLTDVQDGMKYLALWFVVVFVSILIHELGHVFMGRIFGSDGHIVLYGFGGLAIGSNQLDKRWQRIAVSFAGPLAQFVLLGLVLLTGIVVSMAGEDKVSVPLRFLYIQMVWVNSFWPLVNLLPIWPLDGGMIARELFQATMRAAGTGASLVVSMIVAGTCSAYSIAAANGYLRIPFIPGDMYLGLFFALFAVSNFQEWQMLRDHSDRPWKEEPPDSW